MWKTLIRAGETARAESLVAAFRAVRPDTAWLAMLQLMLACVQRGPGSVDWSAMSRRSPAAVLEAARASAVGLRHPGCAEPGLRALLALRPDDPSLGGIHWGALLVLQGLLVGEGRLADARAALNAAYARGTSAVLRIYLVDAGLGVGTDSGASRAAAAVRAKWRLAETPTPSLWDLGLWAWRRRDEARLDSIVTALAVRLPRGDPRDSAVWNGMAGRALLLRDDTTAAMTRLAAVRAVGSTRDIAWDVCAPAAEERLLLARLLLARRDHERAAAVAAAFDLPGPVAFLPRVAAAVEIRTAAARAMGQVRAVAGYAARLAEIGRASKAGARSE